MQSLRQQQWKSASSSFEKALKLDPHRADAENGLGVALGKLGDQKNSLAAFRRAIEIDSGYAEAHYNLALWLRVSGDVDQTLSELTTAIKLRPDYEDAQVALALIFQEAGDTDKAVQEAIKQKADDPLAYDTLGLLLGKAGSDPQTVIEQFQKAIQLRPTFAEAHNHLGLALIQTGDDERAIKEFREALRFNQNYAEAHGNLGATFDTILPIAKIHRVAAINWGFVAGKTQTYLPWDSWERPYVKTQPPVWFHDVLHGDGAPYRKREAQILRDLTGKGSGKTLTNQLHRRTSPLAVAEVQVR